MNISVFAFLRWAQQNPKWMRVCDLLLGLICLALALWQNSVTWVIVSVLFLLAAIFRLGERLNFFLPKIQSPEQDKDA